MYVCMYLYIPTHTYIYIYIYIYIYTYFIYFFVFSDYISHCVGMTFSPKSNSAPQGLHQALQKWSRSLLFKEDYLRGVNHSSHAPEKGFWFTRKTSSHTNGESHLLPMSGKFFLLFLRKSWPRVYIFFLSNKMREEKLIIFNEVEITPSL